MSCEIEFAHAHVRAPTHVCDVRAKRLSKRACNVHACGPLSGVQSAIAILHVFRLKRPEFLIRTLFFTCFLAKKPPNFSFSHCSLCLFTITIIPGCAWIGIKLGIYKKSGKFALELKTCGCECDLNFEKTQLCMWCACGPTIEMCGRKSVATHTLII